MAIKLSVWNFKGGVGKTSISLGLAAVLSKEFNRRTLYVDMDPQGNGSSILGYTDYEGNDTITDILNGSVVAAPKEVIGNPNLFVLASNDRLDDFKFALFTRVDRDHLLSDALNYIDSDFDYIIIDCPPSKDPLISTSLNASDGLLVPVESAFAIKNLDKVIRMFNSVKKYKPDLTFKGIIQNRFVKNHSTSQATRVLLEQSYELLLLETKISATVEVEKAQFTQTLLDKDSKPYQEFIQLAKEIFYL